MMQHDECSRLTDLPGGSLPFRACSSTFNHRHDGRSVTLHRINEGKTQGNQTPHSGLSSSTAGRGGRVRPINQIWKKKNGRVSFRCFSVLLDTCHDW